MESVPGPRPPKSEPYQIAYVELEELRKQDEERKNSTIKVEAETSEGRKELYDLTIEGMGFIDLLTRTN